MWSAQQAEGEKEKITKNELTITLIISLGTVIIFMILLPYLLTNLIGFSEEKGPVMFNLVDGIIRIAIFLAYIIAISYMKDVRTLFQYHGAEHKAIHCYEHGKRLSTKNVQAFTTLHPRCGTSFLLLVFIVSIIVFSILPSLIVSFHPGFVDFGAIARKSILVPVRILLIPAIAGISYEILKLSDKKKSNIIFRIVSSPGLVLQKITTQEPTDRQVEVAIVSLKKLLDIEGKKSK